MRLNIRRQEELLKKYGIRNYTVKDNKIIVHQDVWLLDARTIEHDFLRGVTVEGGVYLDKLVTCDRDFLKGTIVKENISLPSIIAADVNFLKETTICGNLSLDNLQFFARGFLKGVIIEGDLTLNAITHIDKHFLWGTVIGHFLNLNNLVSIEKDALKKTKVGVRVNTGKLNKKHNNKLKNNFNLIKEGYYEKEGYCYFDNMLLQVISKKAKDGCEIYESHFYTLVKKRWYIVCSQILEECIERIELKIKNHPLEYEVIYPDTLITIEKLMGLLHFSEGCRDCFEREAKRLKIKDDKITAGELLKILEKDKHYELHRFRRLFQF